MQNTSYSKTLYESGRYFKEGMHWYKKVYLSSLVTRNFYILISIIFVTSLYVLYLLVNNFFPMNRKITLVMEKKRDEDKSIVMEKISQNYHPTLAIARVILRNYVQEREEYLNPGFLALGYIDQKIQIVKNLSSRSVYSDFEKFIDKSNQDGYLYNFQNSITRNIKIESIEFEGASTNLENLFYKFYPGSIPNRARVIFISEAENEKKRFLAKITFDIKIPYKLNTEDEKNIYVSEDKAKDSQSKNVQFVVLKYELSKLGR